MSTSSRQALASDVPLDLANPIITHDPQRLQFLSYPSKVLDRIIRLDSHYQFTCRRNDVHALSGTGQNESILCDLQSVRHPVLRKVEGSFVGDLGAVVGDIKCIDGAGARGIESRATSACARNDGARYRPSIRDVQGFSIRCESDAVWLNYSVINQNRRASVWIEAIRCRGELRSCIGKTVKPRVLRVSEEDLSSHRMHSKVVDTIELKAEVIVQEHVGAICGWVHSANRDTLLGITDRFVAAAGREDNEAITESPAIWSINRWIGKVIGNGRRIVIEVHNQLRKVAWWRSKNRDEQKILLWRPNRSFVYCLADLENKLVGRILSKVLQSQLAIVDNKAGIAQKIECWCVRDRGVAEVVLLVSGTDCAVERVWQDSSLWILAGI